MGVSLYVMPLRIYLTGRFKTVWESKGETMGGKEGFRITPEGVGEGAFGSPAWTDARADAYVERLKGSLEPILGVRPDWDEGGECRLASGMSYGSYARPAEAACRFAGAHDFTVTRRMGEVSLFLPLEFAGVMEVPNPADPEATIAVASAYRLRDELVHLERLLAQEPRAAELEEWPPHVPVTGLLAEFVQDVSTVRHLQGAAALSGEHRLPLILES